MRWFAGPHPRFDRTKVSPPLPMETPWRVVLIADGLGPLLESETLYCLNEPSKLRDVSWIKPGKITFPWWNGDVSRREARLDPLI